MTTDREAFLASFKEYLVLTPAVELLNDYTYLLIYINHDPYDEQRNPVPVLLVDAASTVGIEVFQVDTWRAGAPSASVRTTTPLGICNGMARPPLRQGPGALLPERCAP